MELKYWVDGDDIV
ncbi:hypothetical protein Bhyg_13890 [Pseudolycoriella hygida]|uniref:Uncharacterized protein n=1 Tax=Pseudolycoriella hygida TaxID=35572 RepID=A0A9Q0RV43_9DIPT|nr:hypothetical protein Bhyg_13890 [Pseudolycoriella hygida]